MKEKSMGQILEDEEFEMFRRAGVKCKLSVVELCADGSEKLLYERDNKEGEMKYPKHKHPHGIKNVRPNEYRLWVCTECSHVFTDEEIREDETRGWGHACKSHPCRKGQRCESHLEPYMPEPEGIRGR